MITTPNSARAESMLKYEQVNRTNELYEFFIEKRPDRFVFTVMSWPIKALSDGSEIENRATILECLTYDTSIGATLRFEERMKNELSQ